MNVNLSIREVWVNSARVDSLVKFFHNWLFWVACLLKSDLLGAIIGLELMGPLKYWIGM